MWTTVGFDEMPWLYYHVWDIMNTSMRLAKQLIYDVLLFPYIYIADIVSVIKEFPSNMSASRYICDVTIQQNGKYIQHDKLKNPAWTAQW